MEHIPLHQIPSSQSILATQAYHVELTPMGGESNADFLIVTTYAITDATTTIKKVMSNEVRKKVLYNNCVIRLIQVWGL